MVKQDAKHAKAVTSLVKKLITRFKPEEPPVTDPVVQLVLSFLNWNASTRRAEDAYDRLLAEFVDLNEVRVSSVDQIAFILGDNYPEVRPRVIRMKQTLHEVFLREHALSFASTQGKGKKELRHYLDTLPGITPYVAAQVMLISFNGHAMPVDEKLVLLLEREGCVKPGHGPADAEAFLLKQVKAAGALRAHAALQAWADTSRIVPPETTAAPVTTKIAEKKSAPITRKAPAKKASTKNAGAAPAKNAVEARPAAKKTTMKKASAKKPATKKPTKKTTPKKTTKKKVAKKK